MAVSWAAHGEPRGAGESPDSAARSLANDDGGSACQNLDEARASNREPTPRILHPSPSERTGDPHHVALKPAVDDEAAGVPETPIIRALRVIDDCQARYETVSDYVCTFSKRERIDGQLTPMHVMEMKVRTRPRSIYVKFRKPSPGREAIYIDGRNDGKVLAHEVGLKRLVAGTLTLDPTGDMAMEDNRHPITQAGIGPLLDTIEARWSSELDPSESLVAFRNGQLIGTRPCILIETTHPRPDPAFLFYRVRVFIDRELGLPIRFEAYDWPAAPGSSPELVEEYTYTDVRCNVGLRDVDFDVSNADYAFGRF